MLESSMENIKSTIESKLEKKTLAQVLTELQETVEVTLKFFDKIDTRDLSTLLRAFKLLKENREFLKSIYDVINSQYDLLSKTTIPAVFEELEIDSIKMHGRNFICGQRINWSLNSLKREEGLQWLRDNGLDSIIREDVNAKTLTSALREKLENEAISPPQNLMNILPKTIFK